MKIFKKKFMKMMLNDTICSIDKKICVDVVINCFYDSFGLQLCELLEYKPHVIGNIYPLLVVLTIGIIYTSIGIYLLLKHFSRFL